MRNSPETSSSSRLHVAILLLAVSVAACDPTGSDVNLTPETVERTPFSDASLNFMVIGDWGQKGSSGQRSVAEAMGREAARDRSAFVISTGDNFYDNGVESTDDSHWMQSFESVYTHRALDIPWYAILGNHDYKGNIDAQIDYSFQSERWHMPARFWQQELTTPDGARVQLIFLDTEALDADQLIWLHDALADSDAEWRLVVGHRPPWSSGSAHGDDADLIAALQPIFTEYGIHAYFSGHSHSLQHQQAPGPTAVIVSGAGSEARPVVTSATTCEAHSVRGFAAVSVGADEMKVQLVDDDGRVRYEVHVPRDVSAVPLQRDNGGLLRCGW